MVALHCSQLNYRDLIIDKALGRPAWASPLCLQTLGGTVVATTGSDHRAVWIRPSTQREHHRWPAALAFADSPAKVYKSRYSSWHGPFHRSVYYYYYINGLGGACQITSAQSASRRENWNSVCSRSRCSRIKWLVITTWITEGKWVVKSQSGCHEGAPRHHAADKGDVY